MPRKKMKLLIIDDEKDICNFVKLLFKKKGFLTYSALSATRALNIVKKAKPNIALLDIYLKKGMDGLGLLGKIKEIAPDCRCIMVTWDKAQAKTKEAKALGAFSYLTKPLTTSELFKAAERAVCDIRKRGC
ncbi:MAG: response regulator [Candidatus Omnitrophica bacterium]|nr:response regulator [Candidatus Omnitrophota bacterium]